MNSPDFGRSPAFWEQGTSLAHKVAWEIVSTVVKIFEALSCTFVPEGLLTAELREVDMKPSARSCLPSALIGITYIEYLSLKLLTQVHFALFCNA